ncbi:MAG TPA: FixH family protein [Bacillaceae bacterium]
MKRLWAIAGVASLLLAACGSGGNTGSQGDDGVPEILEVQLEVQETADVNEKIPLHATVIQGDEKVADADEVEYEIWEDGKKEDSQMIEAKNNKDGTYSAETSFEKDGVYMVQVHVTARGQHTMPKKTVTVGEGVSAHAEGDHHEGSHGHNHGVHAEGFGMHFVKPESAAKGQEQQLVVHLQMDDSPMKDARVRYEIWNHNAPDRHEWAKAEERKPGEYAAAFSFKETGAYTIVVHVENDEGLHEHEEHEIEVK